MTEKDKKKLQQALIRWQKKHADIKALRKAYREKILDLVVKSMEFEKEPVDINRLRTLLGKKKTAPN